MKTEKPASLYDDTNPDWSPSINLGYDAAVPDDLRYNTLRQRNARRVSNAIESEDESMETGVACQTEKVESCNAESQTEKELTELTITQRKELLEIKKENSCLKEKLEKKASRDIFSEEFLMNEKNQHILKFYTGTYAAYSYRYLY